MIRVSLLSGDGPLNKHTFEAMNETIRNNEIELKNDKFIVATDTELLWPISKNTSWSNTEQYKHSALYCWVRGALSYRAVGLSRLLIESIPNDFDILKKQPEVGLFADFIKTFKEISKAN